MNPRVFSTLFFVAACHGSGATTLPRDEPNPHAALEAVARGERTLYSLTDEGHGFTYVLRRDDASGEDPRADSSGSISNSTRVCDAGDPVVSSLTTQLRLHFEPDFAYVPLVCEGLVCSARGPMEFATSLRFEFERVESGGIVLERVFEIEDVALTDEAARARWLEAEEASRQDVGCRDTSTAASPNPR